MHGVAHPVTARPPERTQAPDPRQASLLRFAMCGSVDDGKSTLIGRLLHDAGLVPDDQLAALARDSRGRSGLGPEGLDFSLLVDGLRAEREQGITIDVAYRYFGTARRRFIVADSPGHEQYTRNMATAASNAAAAVILVDARKGVVTQTRRHAAILSLFGVRRVAAAVNKMDLAAYDRATVAAIGDELCALARGLGGLDEISVIPVCARDGDNVVRRSPAMGWYGGPTLLEWLEGVDAAPTGDADERPFRMPIQWVNRASSDFRGVSGMIASGRIEPGDAVVVAGRPGRRTRIARIVTMDGDLARACAGRSVTLVLADDIDAGRGDLLAAPGDRPPAVADRFAGHLVWLGDEPMLPGRSYLMRIGTALVPATATELKHRLDVETLERRIAAKTLAANEVGFAKFATDRAVAFDAFGAGGWATGAFVLIDRATNATVGAGTVEHPLDRANNVAWQAFGTDRAARAGLKGQKPAVLWLTGLSGAGKSTIADAVERKLTAEGRHVYILDGDNIRHGLNKDLGFTDADRVENVRRVAEVARLMADAGLIVLVSLISPFRRERAMAREIAGGINFAEVYVETPLSVCEARDPKGLYAKARAGAIRNFTGIDSAYEPPEAPDLTLDGWSAGPDAAADAVIAHLRALGSI